MSQAECFKDLLGSAPVPLENRIEKGDLPAKAILGEMGISLVGKLDFGDNHDSLEYPTDSKLKLTKRFIQEHAKRVSFGFDRVTAEGRISPKKDSSVVNGRRRYWFEDYTPKRIIRDRLTYSNPFDGLDSHHTEEESNHVEELVDYEALDRFYTRQEAISAPTLHEPVLRAMSVALFGK